LAVLPIISPFPLLLPIEHRKWTVTRSSHRRPQRPTSVSGVVQLSPVSPSKCCELGSIEIYQSAPGNRTATVVVKRLTADPSPSPHNAKAQRPVQPVAGFLCLSALGGVSS
jgi:hypothetical protein